MALHEQRCAEQSPHPRRNPTTTLIDSLSSLRPQEATGSAMSQSPECGADTVNSLALSIGFMLWMTEAVLSWLMAAASHERCDLAALPDIINKLVNLLHRCV